MTSQESGISKEIIIILRVKVNGVRYFQREKHTRHFDRKLERAPSSTVIKDKCVG